MKKILVVAMVDSIHTARWLRQFDQDDFEFIVFPSTPNRRIHPLIRSHRGSGSSSKIRISRLMTLGALPLGILDLITRNFFRAKLLAREIDSLQPDLIHIMETQHAGYLTAKALTIAKSRPRIVLSIWGSDLFWFHNFQSHSKRIRSLLGKVDLLVCECSRDQKLAQELGFEGSFFSLMPATGGIDLERILPRVQLSPVAQRKKVAIKGYSGFVGLGLDAVKVIRRVEREVGSFSFVLYSAGIRTWLASISLRRSMGERLRVVRKHKFSISEIEDMFLASRAAVGLSLSDGLPATVKEAMCFGAFPIQTSTSCAAQWFAEGKSGLTVSPGDIEAISAALLKVLTDDELVEVGLSENLKIAKDKFSISILDEMAHTLYNECIGSL